MPCIIFKCPHIKGGGRSAAHLSNYVKYTATREGVERIAKRENYVDYIANRPHVQKVGTHGLFTAGDEPLVLSRVADEVANHPGVVWLPIISLKRDDAARLGFDNAARWQKLLSSRAMDVAEAMKIPYEQFRWYAAFHDEGNHPHVHMVVYSADGKSGFLTTHGIEEIKSTLAKEIFQQDLITIYQRQTQRRDELTQDAEDVMARLVIKMQSGTLENQRIGQLITELAQRLRNTSGKKQYGYLSPPLKSLVDEIVVELEKDPRIAAAYDLWYREREEVLRTYKDDLPERVSLSRQKEFKRIKNIIIGEAAKLGDTVQEVETIHTGDGGGRGGGEGGDGDRDADNEQPRHEPTPTPPPTVKATLPLGLVVRSTTSLLYQVGRIFEDQHPRPTAGPRVEVDSKLKRKIREKKIAMGHKPDDHEEQTMG